jgi:hypothetical protein
MTPFVIVFITAAPLFLLFLGRRTRARRGEVSLEDHTFPDAPVVSEAPEMASIAELPLARAVIEQIAEGPAQIPIADEQGEELIDTSHAVCAPELDSPNQSPEEPVRGELSGTEETAVNTAGTLEQSPATTPDRVLQSPSSQSVSDESTPATDIETIETLDMGEIVVSQDPAPLVDPPSSLDTIPQPDYGLPEETDDDPSSIGVSQTNADSRQVREALSAEKAVDAGREKAPVRYQPPVQRPPRPVSARPVNQRAERSVTSDLSLEIRVRLRFDRSGFCEFSLLPVRRPELDDEVEVKSGSLSLLLVSQEDWYQDLQFEDIGGYLLAGLELKGLLANRRRVRWLLTGRDIYVLASHPRASYFVSTNQLALGRSHVVMCLVGVLNKVEGILNEAGCQGYTKLDESHGVPSGWVVLSGVAPTRAIPLDLGIDPLYAIKPAPNIEIELEGGVRVRNSIWLAGYPPQIKLLGPAIGGVKILFDGKQVQPIEDGHLVVDGSDRPGKHSVYCEGLSCSRTYSIEEPPESWEEWPAYQFGSANICGPLVELRDEAAGRRIITVPMSNPLLLGAAPGQIFWCSSRNVARWKGFVPFHVVWALPAHPLVSDKRTARILQLADAPVVPPRVRTNPAVSWSNAILDASRKGLRIDTGFSGSAAFWGQYKKVARSIRKGRR